MRSPLTMERLDVHGDWTYLDEFRQMWRLARTGDPSMPFMFMLLEKNVEIEFCTCLSISRDPLCPHHGDPTTAAGPTSTTGGP